MPSGKYKLRWQWNTIISLFEWPKPKILTTVKTGEHVKEQEGLFTARGNAELHSCFGRQFGSFLQNKHTLPNNLATALLGIYPNELKIYIHTKSCI